MDLDRFAEAQREVAERLGQPFVEIIPDEVVEAALERAADLLAELAPPAAAVFFIRSEQLATACEDLGNTEECLQFTNQQMVGAALFHCVQVLEMIRQAATSADADE